MKTLKKYQKKLSKFLKDYPEAKVALYVGAGYAAARFDVVSKLIALFN